ncbi:hypothetical protein [Methylobacterium planeticum]|uniref:Uncharacterized protein n=1 Tax=Methylobacterium planeticum TaxID=2615211 RepID=A0A6N6MUV2_9HYPH|nr:hypothetical protein [Methylobacterium planeticum]KAB1073437.1 hypothetical protein F6X51_11890 [Methylobacterium planeticum]
MYSDLDRARQGFNRTSEILAELERVSPDGPEDAVRHNALLHIARLRAYIALGRVAELERSTHAHRACEGPPTNRLF